uniref:ABC-type branched-chain amino acid transport system, substrate-binding protein n=1 Tax=Candidatus Kentrum sp. LFY TaxID=2126342 RepID=A0A450WWY1_9GAMM|nr:MAG: ABC-type branched-chain amino acid transport system, substrate-binding protein [Candidatus Kentron sp. LFY]
MSNQNIDPSAAGMTDQRHDFGYQITALVPKIANAIQLIGFVAVLIYSLFSDREINSYLLIPLLALFGAVLLQTPLHVISLPNDPHLPNSIRAAQYGSVVMVILAMTLTYLLAPIRGSDEGIIKTINSRLNTSIVLLDNPEVTELRLNLKNHLDVPVEKIGVGEFSVDRSFSKNRASLDVLISTEKDGVKWTQRAIARRIRDDDTFSVSKLKWEENDFIFRSPKRSKLLNVGVIIPSILRYEDRNIRCQIARNESSIAGESLSLGVVFFEKQTFYERRINLHLRADGADISEARKHATELAGKDIIAFVGSYNSRVTREIVTVASRKSIPHLTTDSSAVKLAQGNGTPFFFRLTVNNKRRAEDLIAHLSQQASAFGQIGTLYIIFEDDVGRARKSGYDYANGQVQELRAALSTSIARGIGRVRTIAFQKNSGEIEAEIGGFEYAEKKILPIKTFQELVGYIDTDSSRGRKTAIFVALDDDIVSFGRAVSATNASFDWYVPGPREVFEYDWKECYKGESYIADLEGGRLLSPGDANSGFEWWRFFTEWSTIMKDTPLPARSIRMFDALSIINEGVLKVDEMNNEYLGVFVEKALYRDLLRKEIQAIKFRGVGGLIAFDERGESLTPLYLLELNEGRLRPLWSGAALNFSPNIVHEGAAD